MSVSIESTYKKQMAFLSWFLYFYTSDCSGIFKFLLLQDPVVRPLYELDTNTLEDLLPEIPTWVKDPDCDRVCISFNLFPFFFFKQYVV